MHVHGFEPCFGRSKISQNKTRLTIILLELAEEAIDEDLLLNVRKFNVPHNLRRWKDELPTFAVNCREPKRIWILCEDVFQKCLGVHNHVTPETLGCQRGMLGNFFNMNKKWKIKKKGLGDAGEEELKKRMLNYYYYINKEMNEDLHRRLNILVIRSKMVAKNARIPWNPEAHGVVLPRRKAESKECDEVQEARETQQNMTRKYKASAPISSGGRFVMPSVDDILQNKNPRKFKQIQNRKERRGAEPVWKSWNEKEQYNFHRQRRYRIRNKNSKKKSGASLTFIYPMMRDFARDIASTRKICGFLPTCVRHKNELCEQCTENGEKMNYAWVCVKRRRDICKVFSCVQGYFPKLVDDNKMPTGDFEVANSLHCRFVSPRDA